MSELERVVRDTVLQRQKLILVCRGNIEVDSLSPASAAFATSVKQVHDETHRTFYDRGLLQARANTLSFNKDVYIWLINKKGTA